MKRIIIAITFALVGGCASLSGSDNAASGTSASNEELPLYLQNPANCAEAGLYCRRW